MVFIFRARSLRAFCLENRDNPITLKNFQRWISIKNVPSDDTMRYSMQTVSSKSLNGLLKDLHHGLERKKILFDQKLFGRHDMITLDGTGQISSKNINCEKCLTKNMQNGDTCFHHGQLLASMTNAKASYSLPLQFEPIERDDVDTLYSKNDCELNAGKRLIQKLRIQFPKRSFCILADSLFGVDPILRLILERNWHFIITAKPDRNPEVFFRYDYLKESKQSLTTKDNNGNIHQFGWSSKLQLKQYSKSEKIIEVNFFDYKEINSKGEITFQSSWITDFEITKDNVKLLVQAGRARFVIENRNFNEQKNLGFQTEHNFGHFGNLPNVFFGLAQIAQLFTELFSIWQNGKIEIKKIGSKRRYFEILAVLVGNQNIEQDSAPIFYLKFDFSSS
jgi:hypothetical protein